MVASVWKGARGLWWSWSPPYVPFPLFDLTPALVLYCVVLFSRSQNKDVSPRKVLPYICMAPSPDTSCSFSQCVNANSAWLLPPTVLVWLHSYPSSCSVCDTLPSRLLQKLMLQVLPLVWRYRISCLLPSWGRGLILALLPCYLLDGITSLRWPPKAVV